MIQKGQARRRKVEKRKRKKKAVEKGSTKSDSTLLNQIMFKKNVRLKKESEERKRDARLAKSEMAASRI